MARFPYTKLNAKVNQEVVTIAVEGTENTIEVRQYLPIDEKLGLIGRVIELAHDTNNFSNPVKAKVFYVLEIISSYTNIVFTEKQKESPNKLYDALVSSGWVDTIMSHIPEDEKNTLWKGLNDTIEAYYNYRNSVLGILENVSTDYSNLNLDITSLQEKLSNGENIDLVKNILGQLG